MEKYFANAPEKIEGENIVATADNGRVRTENGNLHVETETRHYIYKHNADPVGWYEENIETSEEYYLGEGASPTADFINLEINDTEAWEKICTPAEVVRRRPSNVEE